MAFFCSTCCIYARKDSLGLSLLNSLFEIDSSFIFANLDSSYSFSKKALSIIPNDQCFALNCALLAAIKGDLDTSTGYLEPFIVDESASSLILCVMGLLDERLGMPNEARSVYSRAIMRDPSIVESLFFKELFQRNHQWLEETILRFNPYVIILSDQIIDIIGSVFQIDHEQIEIGGQRFPLCLISKVEEKHSEIERLAQQAYRGKSIPDRIPWKKMEQIKKNLGILANQKIGHD